jgi:hypothetical protein
MNGLGAGDDDTPFAWQVNYFQFPKTATCRVTLTVS